MLQSSWVRGEEKVPSAGTKYHNLQNGDFSGPRTDIMDKRIYIRHLVGP